MHFHECQEGDYRIFIGALESPRGGGYTAALVMRRASADAREHDAFRDDSLACGYRWPTPERAIHYALARARDLVRKRSPMLMD
jgi:hypothetical protein